MSEPVQFNRSRETGIGLIRGPVVADVLAAFEEVQLTGKRPLPIQHAIEVRCKVAWKPMPIAGDRSGKADIDLIRGPVVADILIALKEVCLADEGTHTT